MEPIFEIVAGLFALIGTILLIVLIVIALGIKKSQETVLSLLYRLDERLNKVSGKITLPSTDTASTDKEPTSQTKIIERSR